MHNKVIRLSLFVGLLMCVGSAFAISKDKVVYPEWFKDSFYDLTEELEDARKEGKEGIVLFFSMKTCSFCMAIIESTFQQDDIVNQLRANYHVIGLDVFGDTEVVDLNGKFHWMKDFAVQEKAMFTPSMIFYDSSGNMLLRLIGYQSPEKFRGILSYLEGKHYTQMKLSEFLQQGTTAIPAKKATASLNLQRRSDNSRPLLVVFESEPCSKCQQLRAMLKATVLQSYIQKFDVAYVSSADSISRITTPKGESQSAKAWSDQLGLIHSPAMIFFNEQGHEVLRVDTDILIDKQGKQVPIDDERALENIRARLQFVQEKGYFSMPQFQRWRARQSSQIQ